MVKSLSHSAFELLISTFSLFAHLRSFLFQLSKQIFHLFLFYQYFVSMTMVVITTSQVHTLCMSSITVSQDVFWTVLSLPGLQTLTLLDSTWDEQGSWAEEVCYPKFSWISRFSCRIEYQNVFSFVMKIKFLKQNMIYAMAKTGLQKVLVLLLT